MNLILQIEEIKKQLEGKILYKENLSKYSWFNLGGAASVVYKPKNLNELSVFLKNLKGFKKIHILGAGSNTLIRDGGFDGVVIKLGKSFSHLSQFKGNMIIAGASAYDKDVSRFAIENSLSGFEFLSCIPGTIGGAIKMNSGCYNNDISKIITSVQAMDLSGNVKIIYSSDLKFSYRNFDFDEQLIFISATFTGKKEKKSIIEKKTNELIEKKKKDQPSKIKTCGSTFKNPKGKKAWLLIKNSGCAGINVGGAQISNKHCNFFVNNGKAKSQDLEDLIHQVRSKVLMKTGIELELELQIIGESL